MKIHLGEIPAEGLRLQIAEDSWFPDSEIERCSGVTAEIVLRKKNQRIFLEGMFETSVKLTCDRCLEDFCLPLDSRFKVDFELVESLPAGAGEEHVCSRDEMDMVFLDEPVIDLFQVLAQQVFLVLPVKKLCARDCAGLCTQCGANLNQASCGCSSAGKNSPFSVLKSLKQ